MKVGIDLRPLQEYSRFRGIGTVTYEITKSLIENFPQNEYFFFFYKNLFVPKDLDDLLTKGKVNYLENYKKSLVFGRIFSPRIKLVSDDKIDVFLATDPGKRIPRGNFKKVVIFYDIINLLFTDKYLRTPSKNILITVIKFIKYLRFIFAKIVILKQFKHSLEADRILAISETTKKDLVNYFKIPDKNIAVMPLAAAGFFKKLENSDLKSIQSKYSLEDKFIFYVGGLDYRKNVLNLIKAIDLIKDENFPQLIVAGKDVSRKYMPEAMEIRDFITKRHLGSKVKLLDYIENSDLVKFYNSAEFFVFPSLYEGFGLGVLEAMACGTPVVCSDTEAVKEIGGNAVLYFDPKDLNDMAEKLTLLFKDTFLRRSLTEKGSHQVRKFSWKKASVVANNSFQVLVKK